LTWDRKKINEKCFGILLKYQAHYNRLYPQNQYDIGDDSIIINNNAYINLVFLELLSMPGNSCLIINSPILKLTSHINIFMKPILKRLYKVMKLRLE
jgi:hypothetical protein